MPTRTHALLRSCLRGLAVVAILAVLVHDVSAQTFSSAIILPSPAPQGSSFGWSVAFVGDINGDGVPDIAIGTNALGTDSAAPVYVFNGRDQSLLLTIQPPDPAQPYNSESGRPFGTTAALDDVNSDGVPDILVGSPNVAYVFSGLDGTLIHTLGTHPSSPYRAADVGSFPDVGGDGVEDIFAGGRLFSGATGEIILDFAPPPEARFAIIGDVNEDGVPDVFVRVQDAPGGECAVAYVQSGRDGALLQNVPCEGSQFGYDVAALGDVSGDSVPDFAVAENSPHTVTVYNGNGTLLYRATSNASLYSSVAPTSDLDGDGVGDFLVAGYAPIDQVFVYSGRTGTLLFTIDSPVQAGSGFSGFGYAGFAKSAASGVDLNGDGIPDILVGDQNTGRALLFLSSASPSVTPSSAPGNNVAVSPVVGTTVIFSSVSASGQTTVTTSASGPAAPSGFRFGTPPTYYDASTTATYTAPVTFCVSYVPSQFGDLSNLHLFHFDNNGWVDVTTSNDTTSRIICGQVTSLSPFVVAEREVGRVLTSLGPGKVWVGLKNSDDVGIRFDLRTEVYRNGTELVGSGEVSSVPGGSSGFNNAKLNTILMPTLGEVTFFSGQTLSIKLFVRNACSGSGKNSGTARLWFNDSAANSRFDATIGSAGTYYLRNSSALSTVSGTGPRLTVDTPAGAKCSPYKAFGTWSKTLD